MPLVLDEVGLDAQNPKHFPFLVADRVNLLQQRSTIGDQRPVAAQRAPPSQGLANERLLSRLNRPPDDELWMNRGNGVS